ncbi:MAG: transposase [Oscillospiraceae bacterium]|nr:transposase [Oscillospiraceae bacterium]
MPLKPRLSVEEKVEIVEKYVSGSFSMRGLRQEYGLSRTSLDDWIRLYKARGVSGLTPSTQFRKYSRETKRLAVEEYLAGVSTQGEICTKYDITDRRMLRQWIKVYNSHGDFKPLNHGDEVYMTKERKITLEERIDIVSHCIANNKNYGATATQYNITYNQIYGWVKKYELGGPQGLVDRRGNRKDSNPMTEIEKLQAQLKLKEAENLRLQTENDLLKKLDV